MPAPDGPMIDTNSPALDVERHPAQHERGGRAVLVALFPIWRNWTSGPSSCSVVAGGGAGFDLLNSIGRTPGRGRSIFQVYSARRGGGPASQEKTSPSPGGHRHRLEPRELDAEVHDLQFDADSRPTVRGPEARIGGRSAARGRELDDPRPPGEGGRDRETGQEQQRAEASRPGHGFCYPNAVPRPDDCQIRRISPECGLVRASRRPSPPPRCSLPVTSVRAAHRAGRTPARRAWTAAAGARHTGGPWTSGSEPPATTIPNGRGTSTRPTCRRRRCCRITPSRIPDGRDQLHVLPDADREDARGWWPATPERFRLTLKAPRRITHDRRLQGRRRSRARLLRAAGLGPKLGALLFQLPPNLKEPGRLRRVPRRAAAEGARGVRVPPRLVARRRGLRAAEGAQPGAVRRRQREDDADRRDRRLRLLPAARRGLPAGRHRALGRRGRRATRGAGARPSSTSSTRTKARARSSDRRSPGCSVRRLLRRRASSDSRRLA